VCVCVPRLRSTMPQTRKPGQHTNNSSNRTQPISCVAITERASTLKDASLRSIRENFRDASSVTPTRSRDSSTENTCPCQISGTPPFVKTVTLKTVLEFFHVANLENAIARDEAIFLYLLYSQLATQAELLAAILPWSVQRPLQELFGAMNEPGRNCNARSAKRKPLSGSSASSRKRSSGA